MEQEWLSGRISCYPVTSPLVSCWTPESQDWTTQSLKVQVTNVWLRLNSRLSDHSHEELPPVRKCVLYQSSGYLPTNEDAQILDFLARILTAARSSLMSWALILYWWCLRTRNLSGLTSQDYWRLFQQLICQQVWISESGFVVMSLSAR